MVALLVPRIWLAHCQGFRSVLGSSTKGLSTERLCTGREDRRPLLPFQPLLGYSAVETESGR